MIARVRKNQSAATKSRMMVKLCRSCEGPKAPAPGGHERPVQLAHVGRPALHALESHSPHRKATGGVEASCFRSGSTRTVPPSRPIASRATASARFAVISIRSPDSASTRIGGGRRQCDRRLAGEYGQRCRSDLPATVSQGDDQGLPGETAARSSRIGRAIPPAGGPAPSGRPRDRPHQQDYADKDADPHEANVHALGRVKSEG